MAMNRDKPDPWKQDTRASVDHYNRWFMKFAPRAFRESRIKVTKIVEKAILDSNDMRNLSAGLLVAYPDLLPTLRMSCCPPLAVDRLIGLAGVDRGLVKSMEKGVLSARMKEGTRDEHCSAESLALSARSSTPISSSGSPFAERRQEQRGEGRYDCGRQIDRGNRQPPNQKCPREAAAQCHCKVPGSEGLHQEAASAERAG